MKVTGSVFIAMESAKIRERLREKRRLRIEENSARNESPTRGGKQGQCILYFPRE